MVLRANTLAQTGEEAGRKKMTEKDFRRIALGMDGAVESEHMNHPDFRANGKIFATIHQDRKWGMVKLTPEQQQEYLKANPKAFTPENGAWGRAGCTKVLLAAADEESLGEAMTMAWQNACKTKPKTKPAPSKKRIRK
jgi:hypothetical protein